MFNHIENALNFAKENWQNLLVIGVIMVSAITVLIGILKPLVFNKIKCKQLRRTSLAFSNVALCFIATAVWFFAKHISFEYYLHSAIILSIVSILWYWLYENTCLRDLIGKIGSVTLKKFYLIVSNKFEKVDEIEIEKEVEKIVNNVSNKKKTVKADKELKNL